MLPFTQNQLISFISVWLAFLLDIFAPRHTIIPDITDVPPVYLSATRLRQFQTAQVLSRNVSFISINPPQDFYPDYTFAWHDMNDKAMVTYMNGTCYGVFKGVASHFYDMSQSFGLYGSRKVCGSEGCCFLDRGIAGAYYGHFTDLFEAKMRECHSTFCDAQGCPDVILTGHSQGASISTIAAVALADIRPMLFAFGPHKVIHPFRRCDVLDNMETYLRVTSICNNDGLPAYDIIPYVGPWVILGRNTGSMILLGGGGAATMAHNRDQFLLPFVEPCHNIVDYIDNIMRLEPGPLDGFVNGSMCTRNIECKSKSCVEKRCE